MPALMGTGRTALEVCRAAELDDDALALLGDGEKPRAFVDALIAAEHHAAAVKFLAFALDKRPAVWWAWVCARRAHGDEPDPAIQAALEATKAWIADPSDANRRTAMACAEAADFGTPAGCAGLAAFFCGDSLAPPELEPVPPGEFMAAQAIAGCIILAAVMDPPEQAPERYQEFLHQGFEVAEKTALWTPPPPRPAGRGR
ncbi:MAG: hypothetical protein OEY20_07090 [Gemmatimonadota bacterium]|nr:hypothetical protein [Gemmatimonadota bacterium]